MKRLSTEDVEHYREAGFHCPGRAMAAGEAAAVRGQVEAHEAAHGPIKFVKPHLLFTWLDRVVRNASLLDMVEDLIGPNIFCWGSTFFVKEARSPHFVTWHQDANYLGLQPNELVTAWVALTPSNASNGAMRVIPGTHKRAFDHKETFSEQNLLSRGQEIAVAVDEADAVMMVLQPGECSLHNALLVHGSDPNPSDDRRMGFVVRFIPTHVRQTKATRDSALLVRGVDEFNHFDHERSPAADYTAEVRAYHHALSERTKQVVFDAATRNAAQSATGRWN
jgi:hypothetical protein